MEPLILLANAFALAGSICWILTLYLFCWKRDENAAHKFMVGAVLGVALWIFLLFVTPLSPEEVRQALHKLKFGGELRMNAVRPWNELALSALRDELRTNTVVGKLEFIFPPPLGDAGAAVLADVLRSNTVLKELRLAHQDITDVGAIALADALRSNTVLEALSLFGNAIGDAGASALAVALESNTALKELNLRSNKIGDEGAVALADALSVNTALTTVWFSANRIGDSGDEALAEALKSNTRLTYFSVTIGGGGALAFADVLRVNAVLKNLDLSFSRRLGDAGASALANALSANTALIELDLSYCGISDAGTAALADALRSNAVLQKLVMHGNDIGEKGARLLAQARVANAGVSIKGVAGDHESITWRNVISASGLAEYDELETVVAALENGGIACSDFRDLTPERLGSLGLPSAVIKRWGDRPPAQWYGLLREALVPEAAIVGAVWQLHECGVTLEKRCSFDVAALQACGLKLAYATRLQSDCHKGEL